MLKFHSDIRLFLDNDDAGAASTLKIIKTLPQSQDFSDLYKPYKDLNEFLVNTNKSKLPAFTSRFISRCAIVRTETKVQSQNGNLAFTPEGRKSEEMTPQETIPKQQSQAIKQAPKTRKKHSKKGYKLSDLSRKYKIKDIGKILQENLKKKEALAYQKENNISTKKFKI